MEIKTCEEYVLAELNDYKEENAGLRKIIAKMPAEKCRNVSLYTNIDMRNGLAQFRCSACGCELFAEYDSSKARIYGCFLVLYDNTEYVPVKYCPNCGREVMTE